MINKPKIRLYVPDALQQNTSVVLDNKQSHYLVHVMRVNEQDSVLLFNGADGEWEASITQLHKKHTQLEAQRQTREQTALPDCWLVFAPVKNKNDIIIEKAVELGASRIVPVTTQYCVVRNLNEDRMRARIIEAAEQCGRLELPELVPVQSLERVLGDWDKTRPLFFADERGSGMPLKTLFTDNVQDQTALLIGPEGGFSEAEQALLLEQPFVKSFTLGPRILRADTAAISALACLMSLAGDWDTPACHTALAAGSKAQ